MPKISVIVPVYNVEKYLNRCVDSILNQTFADFELILVDDGSPDNSGKICDEYAKKDKRVVVIHKENGGLSDARNAGIDIARGGYVTFIDSDDWIDSEYLNVLYKNATDNEADISAVNLHKEYDDKRDRACSVVEGTYVGAESMDYLYNPEMAIYINVACAKLYKISLFENIRYPVGRLHEDGFTTYKLYFRAKKVHFANDDLYYYYQRNDSIMNENFSIRRIDEYFVYRERADFFKENEMSKQFIDNEKTRLACIFTLTVKLKQSKISKKEKNKYYKIFKQDVKQIKHHLTALSKKQKINTTLYSFSVGLFYLFYTLLKTYRKIKKSKRKKEVFSRLKKKVSKLQNSKKTFAFFAMSPKGGNLGDHALTIAQFQLLSEINFVELPCVDFPIYFEEIELFKKIIGREPIVFTAGGNLGTLWFEEAEAYLRKIISLFPDNKIIVLPNTCYYENNKWGRKEFEKSKEIYNEHKKLKIYVREKVSYELIKDAYNDVTLMPDMVMYLHYNGIENNRQGCLMCLRNDIEKTLKKDEEEKLKSILTAKFDKLSFTDTVVKRNVSEKDRDFEVQSKLNEIANSELMITDRLHGMVFAAITGTPCIVIKSKSYKLQGCYEWIRHLEYIRFAEDLNDIEHIADQIINKQYSFDNSMLMGHYHRLREEVYDYLKGEQ